MKYTNDFIAWVLSEYKELKPKGKDDFKTFITNIYHLLYEHE
jgi:hypothetical protein